MSVTFLTYLWHYLTARAIYDELVRPLMHGRIEPLLVTALLVMLAFLLGRWSASRSRP